MAMFKLILKKCENCGREHKRNAADDFDPPRFCAACSSTRRSKARAKLSIRADVEYSADGRYVLDTGPSAR